VDYSLLSLDLSDNAVYQLSLLRSECLYQKLLANYKIPSIIKIENQIFLPGNDARTRFFNFARAFFNFGVLVFDGGKV